MADNFDNFIDIQKSHQQTFQDMQALEDFFQTVAETTAYGIATESQPFREDFQQVFYRRTVIETDHIQVDTVALFQIGRREQVVHHLLHIHAVRTRDNHQASRVFVIRFVAQVIHHRQLFIAHLGGDLLQHAGAGNLMRQGADHHRAVFFRPHRAHTHRTAAILVDFTDLGAGGNDFRFGRIIRPLYDIQQIVERRLRFFNQGNGRLSDFTQVVRRNIRRHADGDAGSAVEQNIGQARRQHFRLLQGAVKVRYPVNSALPQFAQQQFSILRQTGFGITHRGEGFRIVRRPPVPLTVDQRIAVREGLRHQHHGFITRAIAVRMVFTQHVADGAGGLFEFGAGVQTQFRHRIDDATLDRLQAIANKRQRPVHDDVHGVVKVGVFRKFMQREALCHIAH